ncbi:ABC transporter substrate-binding protein [Bartonella sp. LJL80]
MVAQAGASELRIALQDDPDVLDPAMSKTFVGRLVYTAMCDKLVDISKDMAIVPQLAKSWAYSDDGLVLKMTLRDDVKFHDGTPFNADAAVYSLQRAMTLPESARKSELSSVASVEATGPFELTIHMKHPDAAFLAQLTDRAGMMVSPKAAREMGSDFGLKPVCAGAFRFVERVAQDRIVLEKFDDYWNRDAIKLERLTFLPIADTTVRFANLRAGSVDMIDRLSATDLAQAKQDQNLKTDIITGVGYLSMHVNIANGPQADTPIGKDKLLRQAFSLAIDREAIRDVVYDGTMLVGNQPWSSETLWFDPAYPVLPRDIEKAKQLVKQAGYEGKQIDVLVSHANNPVVSQTMQMIQAMVAEAGFNVSLRSTEYATLLAEDTKGNFEVSREDWSGRVDPDGNIHWFVSCNGGSNIGKYCNPEVDRLLELGRQTLDPAARIKIYHDATSILMDEMPVIYLGHPSYIYAYTNKLHGFVPYPDGMIRFPGMTKD